MIFLGPGDHHPAVGVVKRRLGVFPSDDYYTDELAAHVRGAQMRLGLDPDGLIDDALINSLHINLRVQSRLG